MKKLFSRLKGRVKKQAGFTFVELIVAVAILGICITPIMSAFVVTSRLNMNGRRREQAMTVAQNVVEGVKAFGLLRTVKQCSSSYTDAFEIVPENTSSDKITHSVVSSVLKSSVIDITGYELMNGTYISNEDGTNVTVTTTSSAFELEINNIQMGSIYFDADVTITPNYDKEYVVSYYYEDTFKDAGMSNLKYYDVVVDVCLHDESSVLATYTGTFVDQN